MQSYGQTFLKAYMSTSHTYLEMKPIQFKFHWTKGPSYSSGWQNGLKNQSKIPHIVKRINDGIKATFGQFPYQARIWKLALFLNIQTEPFPKFFLQVHGNH